jgi:hypothetical protein
MSGEAAVEREPRGALADRVSLGSPATARPGHVIRKSKKDGTTSRQGL